MKDGYRYWCKTCVKLYNKYQNDSGYNKKYYKQNRDKIRKMKSRWRKANKDKVNALSRAWVHKNKDKFYAITKAWQKKNKEKMRWYICNRRAKMKSVGGKISKDDWKELLEEANHKCLCCGTTENLSLDHIIPISKGGLNVKENSQVLCRACNSKKGNRHSTDYR